ncbi:hypothetical protein L3X38_035321 [Prunus dulcis]|uniref:Pectin lyase-like superfamily protein n=1 Tax=Prunus dulcis TaxID=3755 RepID=A0AAD4VL59_PRUDU|nr:hypothetical protein L3X38_035321 [Prunus dulcis]
MPRSSAYGAFGAAGDSVTDDTQAFSKAWDAACQAGRSSLVFLVPDKYSFLTQSILFKGPCKSYLLFQLDGRIVAPSGPNKWSSRNSKSDWLDFYGIHGMTMQGDGLIDGRGEKWWNLPCTSALRFLKSSNLKVQGISVQSSPKFHVCFDDCQNVRLEFISINSLGDSPNTDGIHIEDSNNVEIHHSRISAGDSSHDVDITNVTCGPSHGISIGSLGRDESEACVKNITVRLSDQAI